MQKTNMNGTYAVPASNVNVASKSVEALSEQVQNLQKRYYRSLAPDCEIRTESDRWYFRAIATACFGLIFPPLFIATAVCVYKAKRNEKGGRQ